jgi:transcriptional regulator with XRE-family HTH domain
MRTPEHPLIPSLARVVAGMGENIHLARLRRRYSASVVAERAGISRKTLSAIERGEPGVSLGAYARVLLALGLEQDLALVAADDDLGRKIQDAGLTVKRRAAKQARSAGDST